MSERVSSIFAEVSESYDMVNSISSLGVIILWRMSAANEAMIEKDKYALLDIATGTGDLSFEIAKKANRLQKDISITGMDFSPNMLKVAKKKEESRKAGIKFEHGDAMKLKYKDNSFDVVTSSFALRNVDDLNKFAGEAKRVLKKGGKFVFMDMARPSSSIERLFLNSYWAAVSWIGFIESKNAFDWLVESVNRFDKEAFVKILKKTGFKNIKMRNLFPGSSFIVTGNK